MESDKKNKHKPNRLLVVIAIGLLLAVSLLTCSYLFSNAKYGYRTLFVDSKTHYYECGKSFRYGNFEMTFNSTNKPLGTKADCPAQAKTAADNWVANSKNQTIYIYCRKTESQQQCWQREYDNVTASCDKENQNIDQNELRDVQISTKNLSGTIKSLSKDWFKVEVDGKALDKNSEINYYLKDNIGPDEVSSSAFNFKLNKNLTDKARVIVTLPGLASQIVDLKAN